MKIGEISKLSGNASVVNESVVAATFPVISRVIKNSVIRDVYGNT